MEEKKRLITRSDFDGLVCAMLLKELDIIGEIKFVHPKDVQDGKVDITENDITTNLPFDPRVGLAFDHHESELIRTDHEAFGDKYICICEKSAARVVYNYYGGSDTFKTVTEEIMVAVDKGDSADFTVDEILNPKGTDQFHHGCQNRSRTFSRFPHLQLPAHDGTHRLLHEPYDSGCSGTP